MRKVKLKKHLTRKQKAVLEIIKSIVHETGEEVTSEVLAEKTGTSRQNCNYLLRKIDERGWLKRSRGTWPVGYVPHD